MYRAVKYSSCIKIDGKHDPTKETERGKEGHKSGKERIKNHCGKNDLHVCFTIFVRTY